MNFVISNFGKEIVDTDYFETPMAHCFFFLSLNDGCMRLLVPLRLIDEIDGMKNCSKVVVSRGDHEGADSLEILFEDNSIYPYCVYMETRQCDLLPDKSWLNDPFEFAVYSYKGKEFERPGYYRIVKVLPHMEKYIHKENISDEK